MAERPTGALPLPDDERIAAEAAQENAPQSPRSTPAEREALPTSAPSPSPSPTPPSLPPAAGPMGALPSVPPSLTKAPLSSTPSPSPASTAGPMGGTSSPSSAPPVAPAAPAAPVDQQPDNARPLNLIGPKSTLFPTQEAQEDLAPIDEDEAIKLEAGRQINEENAAKRSEEGSFLGRVARGIAARSAQLTGNFADVLDETNPFLDDPNQPLVDDLTKWAEEQQRLNQERGAPNAEDAIEKFENLWGGDGGAVVDNLISLIGDGAETFLTSLPDMLLVSNPVSLGPYIATRTNELANERAKNDGREEADAQDFSISVAPATASALLEKFAFEKVLGAGTDAIKSFLSPRSIYERAKRLVIAGGVEGGQEAAQTGIESAATDVGTEKGFDAAATAREAAGSAILGTSAGVAGGGTVEAGRTAASQIRGDTPQEISQEAPEQGASQESAPTPPPLPSERVPAGRSEQRTRDLMRVPTETDPESKETVPNAVAEARRVQTERTLDEVPQLTLSRTQPSSARVGTNFAMTEDVDDTVWSRAVDLIDKNTSADPLTPDASIDPWVQMRWSGGRNNAGQLELRYGPFDAEQGQLVVGPDGSTNSLDQTPPWYQRFAQKVQARNEQRFEEFQSNQQAQETSNAEDTSVEDTQAASDFNEEALGNIGSNETSTPQDVAAALEDTEQAPQEQTTFQETPKPKEDEQGQFALDLKGGKGRRPAQTKEQKNAKARERRRAAKQATQQATQQVDDGQLDLEDAIQQRAQATEQAPAVEPEQAQAPAVEPEQEQEQEQAQAQAQAPTQAPAKREPASLNISIKRGKGQRRFQTTDDVRSFLDEVDPAQRKPLADIGEQIGANINTNMPPKITRGRIKKRLDEIDKIAAEAAAEIDADTSTEVITQANTEVDVTPEPSSAPTSEPESQRAQERQEGTLRLKRPERTATVTSEQTQTPARRGRRREVAITPSQSRGYVAPADDATDVSDRKLELRNSKKVNSTASDPTVKPALRDLGRAMMDSTIEAWNGFYAKQQEREKALREQESKTRKQGKVKRGKENTNRANKLAEIERERDRLARAEIEAEFGDSDTLNALRRVQTAGSAVADVAAAPDGTGVDIMPMLDRIAKVQPTVAEQISDALKRSPDDAAQAIRSVASDIAASRGDRSQKALPSPVESAEDVIRNVQEKEKAKKEIINNLDKQLRQNKISQAKYDEGKAFAEREFTPTDAELEAAKQARTTRDSAAQQERRKIASGDRSVRENYEAFTRRDTQPLDETNDETLFARSFRTLSDPIVSDMEGVVSTSEVATRARAVLKPYQRTILDTSMRALGDRQVQTVVRPLGDRYGPDVMGAYRPEMDVIELDPAADGQVAMHELIHAATHESLTNPSHPAGREMKEVYDHLKEIEGDLDLPPGVLDRVDEVVAYAITDKQVKRTLMGVPHASDPTARPEPMWKRVVNAILRALGLPRAFRQQSALDAILSNFEPLTQPGSVDLTEATRAMDPVSGGNPLFMFVGESAPNVDRQALRRAQELESGGADANAIWRETMWDRGPDGRWRTEIDDTPAQILRSDEIERKLSARRFAAQRGGGDRSNAALKLSEVMDHPRLFEAVPPVANVSIKTDKSLSSIASYDPNKGDSGVITLNMDRIENNAIPLDEVLLHEVQHRVQTHFGLAPGASPANFSPSLYTDPVAQYERVSGEVEARNTQFRAPLTESERRVVPPRSTEDVPRGEQLVLRNPARENSPQAMFARARPRVSQPVTQRFLNRANDAWQISRAAVNTFFAKTLIKSQLRKTHRKEFYDPKNGVHHLDNVFEQELARNSAITTKQQQAATAIKDIKDSINAIPNDAQRGETLTLIQDFRDFDVNPFYSFDVQHNTQGVNRHPLKRKYKELRAKYRNLSPQAQAVVRKVNDLGETQFRETVHVLGDTVVKGQADPNTVSANEIRSLIDNLLRPGITQAQAASARDNFKKRNRSNTKSESQVRDSIANTFYKAAYENRLNFYVQNQRFGKWFYSARAKGDTRQMTTAQLDEMYSYGSVFNQSKVRWDDNAKKWSVTPELEVFYTFDAQGEQRRALREDRAEIEALVQKYNLRPNGRDSVITSGLRRQDENAPQSGELVSMLEELVKNDQISEAEQKTVTKIVSEMAPDNSKWSAKIRSRNIAGSNTDFMRSLNNTARVHAFYTAQAQSAPGMSRALKEMEDYVTERETASSHSNITARAIHNALQQDYKASSVYDAGNDLGAAVNRFATRITFLNYLADFRYPFIQYFQGGISMTRNIKYVKTANSIIEYNRAFAQLMKPAAVNAWKQKLGLANFVRDDIDRAESFGNITQAIVDHAKTIGGSEYATLIQEMTDAGKTGRTFSIEYDNVGPSDSREGMSARIFDMIRVSSHISEVHTRVASSLGLYKAMKKEGYTQEQIREALLDDVQNAQVDYSVDNEPLLLSRDPGRRRLQNLFMTFLKWPLTMTQLEFELYVDMTGLRSSDPAVRHKAQRSTKAFMAMKTMQLALAGVAGAALASPVMSFVATAGWLLGDSEDLDELGDDKEAWSTGVLMDIADTLGVPPDAAYDLVHPIMYGLPNTLGVDLSREAAQGNVFQSFAYGSSIQEWVTNYVVDQFPVLGVGLDTLATGVELWKRDASWLSVIAGGVPVSGIRDVARGLKIYTEGMTTTRTGNPDVLVPEDDRLQVALTSAAGLQSSNLTEKTAPLRLTRGREGRINSTKRMLTERLINGFAKFARTNDAGYLADAIHEIEAFKRVNPDIEYDLQQSIESEITRLEEAAVFGGGISAKEALRSHPALRNYRERMKEGTE